MQKLVLPVAYKDGSAAYKDSLMAARETGPNGCTEKLYYQLQRNMVIPVAWKGIESESTATPDTNNGFFQVAAITNFRTVMTHNDLLNVK